MKAYGISQEHLQSRAVERSAEIELLAEEATIGFLGERANFGPRGRARTLELPSPL